MSISWKLRVTTVQAVPLQSRAHLAASEQGELSRVLVTAAIDSPGHRKQRKQVQVYPASKEEKDETRTKTRKVAT